MSDPRFPPDEPDSPDGPDDHWTATASDDEIERALAEAATPATDEAKPRRRAQLLRRAGWTLALLGIAWPLVRDALFLWLIPAPIDLLRVLLLVLGAAGILAAHVLLRKHPMPTPTEAELAQADPRARGRRALLIVGLILYGSIAWWARHGAGLMSGIYDAYHVWDIYWTLVATPDEKLVWYATLLCGTLFLIGLLWLVHRFVWRSFFPDLLRHDPDHHRGARPERVGRLYRVRAFHPMRGDDPTQANRDVTRYRIHYKHGGRLFPIFRFDEFDVDHAPQHVLHGVAQVRCGRLEHDPQGMRFRRIANPLRYGSAPLATEFREAEIVEDHNRKTSIVMPGSAMNPRVMRAKFQSERLINPHVARQKRDVLRPMRFARPTNMGGARSGGHAHVDRLDEPAPDAP